MVLLKLYKDNGNRKKKEIILMGSIEEAIEAGQGSGLYYEVIDLASGRIIDWNEVNIRPEEEWWYDDAEKIWVRRSPETMMETVCNPFRELVFGRRDDKRAARFSF